MSGQGPAPRTERADFKPLRDILREARDALADVVANLDTAETVRAELDEASFFDIVTGHLEMAHAALDVGLNLAHSARVAAHRAKAAGAVQVAQAAQAEPSAPPPNNVVRGPWGGGA